MHVRRLVLAGLLLLPLVVRAADPPPVTVSDDKLSLHLRNMALTEVVAEIAKQTGATVQGQVLKPRDLTMEMDPTPLKEGLDRLLVDQNFALVYGADGKLQRIELRDLRQEKRPDAPAADAESLQAKERELFILFDHRKPVPISGNLSKVLGKEEVGWDQLVNESYGNPDPRVRREAVRRAMKAFEDDPDLRASVLDASRNMTDAEFAAFARASCYNRAEDLVRNIARTSSIPEIRSRARDVLRLLRQNPYRGPIPRELSAAPSEG
jgi:hypothetical protein